MSRQDHDSGRRRFLGKGLMAIAAVPAGSLLAGAGRSARAAEDMPKLSMDDPAAKALSYHEDATKVEPGLRKDDSFCHNCLLYTGESGSEWGGCNAFPGKLVHADGWCSAWTAGG